MTKYSKKSQQKVEKAMHEMKEDKLKSGRSDKTVTSRKQAVVAPCFVFLTSDDASYITGRTIHVNGGTVINS